MNGDKLRGLRLERGLTQAELAKIIGVSHKTVINYECGICGICRDRARVISHRLGIFIEDWWEEEPATRKNDLIKCPFYRKLGDTYIRCEGLCSGHTMQIAFARKTEVMRWTRERCMNDYRSCPYYRAVAMTYDD